MLGAILGVIRMSTDVVFMLPLSGTIIIPILEIRKPRHRVMK